METGRSSSVYSAYSRVRSMPRTRPSELTISVTTSPQPPRRLTRRRNAVSVMPAIGASANGGARSMVPIFIRGGSGSTLRPGVRNQLVVRLLQFGVLPLDDRLAANAGQELAHFMALPVGVHPLGDEILDLLERLNGGFLQRLELENLITLGHANRRGHLAGLHRLQQVLQRLGELGHVDRSDQPAGGLGRRRRHFARHLAEVLTRQNPRADRRRLHPRLVVFRR